MRSIHKADETLNKLFKEMSGQKAAIAKFTLWWQLGYIPEEFNESLESGGGQIIVTT